MSGAEMDVTFLRLQHLVKQTFKRDTNGDRLAYVIVLQSGRTISVDGSARPEVQRAMLNSAIEGTRTEHDHSPNGTDHATVGTHFR